MSAILGGGLKKNMRNLKEEDRSLDPGPLEHEGLLTTQPQHSVKHL
jgi:hypothetical protein